MRDHDLLFVPSLPCVPREKLVSSYPRRYKRGEGPAATPRAREWLGHTTENTVAICDCYDPREIAACDSAAAAYASKTIRARCQRYAVEITTMESRKGPKAILNYTSLLLLAR